MESKTFAGVWDAIEATPEAAAETKRRSAIMMALQKHITSAGMTEPKAAEVLGVATSRISDLMHRKLSQFGLDELVHMALVAGLAVLADSEEAGDTDFIAHAREVAEQARTTNRSKNGKSH